MHLLPYTGLGHEMQLGLSRCGVFVSMVLYHLDMGHELDLSRSGSIYKALADMHSPSS